LQALKCELLRHISESWALTGCTTSDLITKASVGASNHGAYVSNIAHLGNALKNNGIITGAQKGALQSCAAGAAIP
jgi:hypothetical protein